MSKPICEVHRLGLISYQEAWDLQNRLTEDIRAGKRPPTLLMLEHPHTYTFGRRGEAGNLLWDEEERARRGIEIHWVDRGGDVTYHGPGQLVGYPLIPLGKVVSTPEGGSPRLPQADYVGYLRKLEQTLIAALMKFGLVSGQIPDLTGVWMQPDMASRCPHCPPEKKKHPTKIASIGVKVDAQGISRHGFALNVAPDMNYWEGIIACGLADYAQISMAELLDQRPTMEAVTQAIIDAFGETFEFKMKEASL